jgi:hypothetical protein
MVRFCMGNYYTKPHANFVSLSLRFPRFVSVIQIPIDML